MKQEVDNYLTNHYGDVYYQTKEFGFRWQTISELIRKKYRLKITPESEYVRGRWRVLNKGKVLVSGISPSQQIGKLAKKFNIELVKLKPYLKGDPNNVLIIGDTHEPFCKEGYLEFCREQQEKYNCGTVVHIGDLVDNHAVSYHDSDPSGKSAGDEYKLALEKCKKWYEVFPNVKICIGNHDALPFRKAFTAGLPSHWLKSYQELFQSPKTWEWDFTHQIAGVIYQHGTGLSGEMASINCARENRQSTVIGHLHTVMNSRFLASYKDLIFGVSVGCGIDHKAYAFAYGKENTRKPVIACAVVLNGKLPINIPMDV